MSEPLVLTDTSDPAITILTINRPDKRNALSIELATQLRDAITAASSDLHRRVLILRANGPAFCAGLDMKEATDPTSGHRSAQTLMEVYLALATSPLVTVAAAHGPAMGGGAGLLSACDFVVAAEDLRIAYPEVHRGLVAALVSTLLRRQLNDRAVRELVLLGNAVDLTRAVELGLVTHLSPRDRLTDRALLLAKQAMLGAPGAIARSKHLLDSLAPRTIEEDLKRALDYHLQARHSTEAAEGMAAFLEKREPRWGPRET
jgi:methylglutaconyl-CoA hydratase